MKAASIIFALSTTVVFQPMAMAGTTSQYTPEALPSKQTITAVHATTDTALHKNGLLLAETQIPAEQKKSEPLSPAVESALPENDAQTQDGNTGDQGDELAKQTDSQILPLPLDDLRKFADVFGRIKQDYVEEVDDSTLLNNAIKGMLAGLDPHSAYLEPSAFDDLQESTTGEFGGLGIEVGMEDGFVKVISPIDDTPAQKAGVEAGDLIIKLDNTPVKGLSLSDAVNKMRGLVGTKIVLTIVRKTEPAPIEITLTRDVIKVTSIKSRVLEDNYGYVRITQFQEHTGQDFKKALEKLKSKMDPVNGFIIDLRNNPGGVLQAAVEVADSLLEEGLIVYTKGRISSSQLSFSATPGDMADGLPIVVLINGGSASASEILSGALQDHHRAVIMGTNSFGKGSVQTVLALNADYGLKLTTARYYTPAGRSIQALGIKPDIVVNRAKLSDEQTQNFFTEADLAGHLSNENGDSQPANNKKKTDQPNEGRIQAAGIDQDFQLQEGLNLLKAIHILGIKQAAK